MADQEADTNIEIWKIKKLIKGLESARGNGTSMISLIMPPRDQVSRVTKMLGDEYGTASNIKSRVNRQSPNVAGLILAGSADFKTELSQSELFDPRLQAKILNVDTGKYVFGVEDTLKALEMGAIETLIVWENLDINRYELKNSTSGEILDMRTFDELSDGEVYEDSD
ncbi:BnaC03g57000D [Brassica napus]|uniref:BnaC03g57000D protein n=1 Tax=Brassica napus TaxID=3708 RepID=A0A078H7W3_BRANA|nr:BnaC03g57000D [Brassica napus]